MRLLADEDDRPLVVCCCCCCCHMLLFVAVVRHTVLDEEVGAGEASGVAGFEAVAVVAAEFVLFELLSYAFFNE
jgi:hypothetical protein